MRAVKLPPPPIKKKLPPSSNVVSSTAVVSSAAVASNVVSSPAVASNAVSSNAVTSVTSCTDNGASCTVPAFSNKNSITSMMKNQDAAGNLQDGKKLHGLSLEDAVSWVVPLLAKFFSRSHLELEVRLGKCKDGRFVSCITRDDFNAFHDMLMSYRGWSNIQEVDAWVSTFDYLLDNDIRCSKSSRGNAFIRKSLLENLTFQCHGKRYDMRFSLKEEVPVEVRVPGIPHLVRVKKRKSFVYCNKYSFDLTVVWSGKDEQEAQNNDPTYEIELECVNKEVMGPDHRYNATSLLEKMIDFIGREGQITFDVVGESSRK